MNSLHYPYIVEHNQYQYLLSKNLENKGCNVLKIKKSLLELFKYCLFFNFQIIHFHWLHGITNSKGSIKTIFRLIIFISCLLICKLKSIKIIWTIHNLSSHEKKNDNLERTFLLFMAFMSDKLLVHSKLAIDIVSKTYKTNTNKIRYIPHGNYLSLINLTKHKNHKYEKFNFLYFGLIRPYKGVLNLINSFNQINIDATLTIAGLCKCQQLNMDIINSTEKNSNITYLNKFLEQDELNDLIFKANIIVLPYIDAFTSGSVVLAISAGKPLVLPLFISNNEYSDELNTITYDSNLPKTLDSALIKAFKSDDLGEMGKNSYFKAEQLNWENIAYSVVDLYNEVLD